MDGRQIDWHYRYFRISKTDSDLIDITDLMSLKLRGDNLRDVISIWDTTLLIVDTRPGDDS